MHKALDWLTVIEVAEFIRGPFCAKLLADLGATVIKIEPPRVGDIARTRGPFPQDQPHPERSGMFQYLNTNKLGVTLDLASAEGRRMLRRLVERADVVVTDKSRKECAALGLDYASLKAIKADLILTTVTPFGHTGLYADFKSYHLTTSQSSLEGNQLPSSPDGPTDRVREQTPAQSGAFVEEYDGGLFAAGGALAAVYARDLWGEGQHVDVSQQEVELDLNPLTFAAYFSGGLVYDRGSREIGAAGLFDTKDGYVVITFTEDHFFQNLVEWMGRPDLAKDPRFCTKAARQTNGPAFKEMLRDWFKGYTKKEIYYLLMTVSAPSGYYADARDIVESPQMAAREFFTDVQTAEAGVIKMPLAPYKLSDTPPRIQRPAPTLGQHNHDVFAGMLGLGENELARLSKAGVL